MSKGKVVIFGSTGTVGAYSAQLLSKEGYDVVAVGRREDDGGFFETIGSNYISVDITEKAQFDRLPKSGVSCVLHFAGVMPSKMQGYHPQSYIDSIVKGTMNVLDYCVEAKAEKIVFTQTRADSHAHMGSDKPLDDNIVKGFPKIGDHSIYTICKNAAVDLIEHYHAQYGLHRFIFRLPTIYAYHPSFYFYVNGQKKEKAYWQLINKARQGKLLEIWGDPSKKKEIFYVKDMAKAVLLATNSDKEGGVYNVGRGVGVTLEEQVQGIADVFSPTNATSEVVYRPDMPDGRQFVHSIKKITDELGFSPDYDYYAMLKDMQQEMQEKPFRLLWAEE